MPADTEALFAKFQALPAICTALEAAGAPPMTEKDITAELETVRAARQSRSTGAARS